MFKVPLLVPLALVVWAALTSLQPAHGIGRIEYCSPVVGSTRVSPHSDIVVRYAEPVDASLDAKSIALRVLGSKSGPHTGRLVLLDDARTLVFTPDQGFALEERVTVRWAAPARTRSGEPLEAIDLQFQISSVDPGHPERRTPAPRSTCLLEARFVPPEKSPASPLTVSNDSLPADLPAMSLVVSNAPDPGAVFVAPFAFSSGYGHLVIVDNLGSPLFYRRTDTWAFDFKRQPNGLLTYSQQGPYFFALDSNYAVVDSFRAGNGYPLTDLHDLLLLDNGHVLLMAKDPQPVDMSSVVTGGHPNAMVTGLILQELDTNRNVVFQWRSWDHFEITDGEVSGYVSLTDSVIDYVHANAVEVDWDGHLLLSSRHMNEITKINRQTGDIIWRLAPNGANNEFTMVNDTRGFSHQHDIRRLPNGDVTLFDNGNFLAPEYSRLVEYQLDEVNKIATLVSEYRNTPDINSPAMGGAQRRATGGTMIGWGMTSGAPQVTDIHANGTKAYELAFDPGHFTYRAFRFPWHTTRFTASSDTLNFGSLMRGGSATRSVFVRNDWTADVTITSMCTSDPQFWSITPVPFTIAPGDSTEVSIHFEPTWIGDELETLYIQSVSPTELVAQAVVLTGTAGTVTDTPELQDHPQRYRLHASSPNPFNPTTSIRYDVPVRTHVELEVFDARGRKVVTLVDGIQLPGEHEVRWHAPDAASGLYIVRMKAGRFVSTRKLTVIR